MPALGEAAFPALMRGREMVVETLHDVPMLHEDGSPGA
jgi:hypothetical protein